jgi:hypothetical protein
VAGKENPLDYSSSLFTFYQNTKGFFDIILFKTMETLSFTLGVLAVIDLLIVVGTFLVLKTLNITRKQAENTQRELDANVRELHYELERSRNDLNDKINLVEEQVVRHIDSRVDKLESKVYKDFDLFRTQGRNY